MGPRIPFAPALLGIRIMCYSPLTIKRKFNLIIILSYVNAIYYILCVDISVIKP